MAEGTRLENALRDLGRRLDVPDPPELSASVRTRLEPAPARPWRAYLVRAAVAAVAVIMAATAVVVTFIYQPRPGRPEPTSGRVAILLDQFDGTPAPVFEKFSYADNVHRVSVGGERALWVQGPHEVVYVDRSGRWRTESARLAANTLIWQINDVTLRLEGNLTKHDALAIARSAS